MSNPFLNIVSYKKSKKHIKKKFLSLKFLRTSRKKKEKFKNEAMKEERGEKMFSSYILE